VYNSQSSSSTSSKINLFFKKKTIKKNNQRNNQKTIKKQSKSNQKNKKQSKSNQKAIIKSWGIACSSLQVSVSLTKGHAKIRGKKKRCSPETARIDKVPKRSAPDPLHSP
jgi:hypothetical protein